MDSRISLLARDGDKTTFGVIGAGAWGTALGVHVARMGHDTLMYARNRETVDSINNEHTNSYLAGAALPPSLRATDDLPSVIQHAELLVMAVPTPYIRATLAPIAHLLDPAQHIIVSCSKGITTDTLETVDEVLQGVLPSAFHHRLAYLSGPSFAAEVVASNPTCVTIASRDEETAKRVQLMMSTPLFRCYRSSDVTGVEVGGALKNVLAIACGISDSIGGGNNGRAALICRGLNEITKMAVAKGGDPLTMAGLAGMGDLVLTCCGDLSRNRTVGLRLGKGESMQAISTSMQAVAEGVLTSKAAHALALKLGLDCPIIWQMNCIIHEGKNPAEAILENMTRGLTCEVDPSVVAANTKTA